jgi:hypothetical protein
MAPPNGKGAANLENWEGNQGTLEQSSLPSIHSSMQPIEFKTSLFTIKKIQTIK